ncbi:MAG: bifunctional folylpolyglutamate synthase/dihydrofolate synthase [Rhodospirillaceae bacterium]|nr:bifunctional folylpolyglutamate synthase/dihydrofolate synthase [Rhodospirillaceae bacterium]MAX63945.1 bifunctional folylpolyglutamate synthase/dihydrofolate synthase [Rhodospirillaceae bacterium]MBB58879.1 bifunctional folylpolyglutamate synthase/dihydrofolate synthase [Rhodospirillaceae bacterium]|tara:strand:- start:101049 stop:102380 length:1332 start_codon:yes stop_codon:yes gene_type:complete
MIAPQHPSLSDPGALGSDTILSRLMQLHPKVIDLSLGRTQDLLDRLGRPQDRLPPVVHVAGTNGKGSTIATLRAIAQAAGYRVHVYTSPHLSRFHERIRLAGRLIHEEALQALLSDCESVNEGRPITFFEITTCAAFKAFSETPGDLLLLETGLGGRLDSTNVVDHPAATIITPISMDHIQFLGDSLAAIAGEKAAIQKSGTPSVIGPQDPVAQQVLTDYAQQVGAPLLRHGLEWSVAEGADGGYHFDSAAWSGTLPRPNLPGAHQQANTATAVAAALVLRDQGFDLPDQAIRDGVRQIEWPARLQTLTQGPLKRALPGWTLTLDGGHNAAAGLALADEIARWDRSVPVHVICGMMNSKAAVDFLRPFAPLIASFQAVTIPGEENSFSATDLCAMAQEAGLPDPSTAESVLEASERLARRQQGGHLLICGSLYLAGRLLVENS